MVPFLVWGLEQRAGEEAGMISIGLYTDAEEGAFARTLTDRFLTEKSVLRFTCFETEEEALTALRESHVDAVWIIPEDLDDQLRELAVKKRIKPVIRVIEREDDVALVFTREVLCSRIFPEFVYDSYVVYVKEHMGEDALTLEELKSIYHSLLWKGNLFREGNAGDARAGYEEENYVLAPLRGLLCIWMVIAGFAALLYHKSDERHGVYDAVPMRKRLLYLFGIQAAVLSDCGVICLLAYRMLGLTGNIFKEILCLLLFEMCIAVFCTLLGLLIKNIEGIGMIIPVIVIMMILLCPIFTDLRSIGPVRGLLPPFYYLKAVSDSSYIPHMVIYIFTGAGLCGAINMISAKRA